MAESGSKLTNRDTLVGYLRTRGSNDGNAVYMGPRGGLYYLSRGSNNKTYINQEKVSNIEFL